MIKCYKIVKITTIIRLGEKNEVREIINEVEGRLPGFVYQQFQTLDIPSQLFYMEPSVSKNKMGY